MEKLVNYMVDKAFKSIEDNELKYGSMFTHTMNTVRQYQYDYTNPTPCLELMTQEFCDAQTKEILFVWFDNAEEYDEQKIGFWKTCCEMDNLKAVVILSNLQCVKNYEIMPFIISLSVLDSPDVINYYYTHCVELKELIIKQEQIRGIFSNIPNNEMANTCLELVKIVLNDNIELCESSSIISVVKKMKLHDWWISNHFCSEDKIFEFVSDLITTNKRKVLMILCDYYQNKCNNEKVKEFLYEECSIEKLNEYDDYSSIFIKFMEMEMHNNDYVQGIFDKCFLNMNDELCEIMCEHFELSFENVKPYLHYSLNAKMIKIIIENDIETFREIYDNEKTISLICKNKIYNYEPIIKNITPTPNILSILIKSDNFIPFDIIYKMLGTVMENNDTDDIVIEMDEFIVTNYRNIKPSEKYALNLVEDYDDSEKIVKFGHVFSYWGYRLFDDRKLMLLNADEILNSEQSMIFMDMLLKSRITCSYISKIDNNETLVKFIGKLFTICSNLNEDNMIFDKLSNILELPNVGSLDLFTILELIWTNEKGYTYILKVKIFTIIYKFINGESKASYDKINIFMKKIHDIKHKKSFYDWISSVNKNHMHKYTIINSVKILELDDIKNVSLMIMYMFYFENTSEYSVFDSFGAFDEYTRFYRYLHTFMFHKTRIKRSEAPLDVPLLKVDISWTNEKSSCPICQLADTDVTFMCSHQLCYKCFKTLTPSSCCPLCTSITNALLIS
jgi:hypothetical protein